MTKIKVENKEAEESQESPEATEDKGCKKSKCSCKDKKETNEADKKELTIEEQLEAKEKEIAELNDKLLRSKADFDNYRKRAYKDLMLARQSSKIDTLTPVLNVFDMFNMAVQASTNSDNLDSIKVGMDMILTEFNKAIDDLGIKSVDATGKKFDPQLHEAVSYETSDDVEEGTIIKQWKCGYQMGDYLIRPATVVVSSGAEDEATETVEEKAE